MEFALWSVIIGLLLILLALSASVLARLPLSTAMLYLAVGVGVSPWGLDLMRVDIGRHTVLLERLTEVIVLVSLFTAGLKLSPGLRDKRWLLPLRLALTSMVFTVAAIAAAAYFLLDLPLGACVLLGGILAPTDPVLASDVQVNDSADRDRLRFALTGEGGLNDGTAFPFVMLGLGLLGLHDLGAFGWRWIAVDLIWAGGGGLLIGAMLGAAVGKLVVYLRIKHQEAVGFDEFLALGLIGISYGAALLAHAYGFLAVFAAGLALQRVRGQDGAAPQQPIHTPATKEEQHQLATDPEHADAYMMQGVRGFNEQLERVAEVAIVLVAGAMFAFIHLPHESAWFIPLLFLLVRPLAVSVGLSGAPIRKDQRLLLSWFGIRGIGSIYYLMFAINHGVPRELAEYLLALTLTVVTASIVLHGISVTPLMNAYARRGKR